MVLLRACSRDSHHEEGSGDGAAMCKHRPQDQDIWPVRRGSDNHLPCSHVQGFSGNYLHKYLQWTPRHCPFIEMWVTVDHSDKYPLQPLSPSSTPLQTEQVPQASLSSILCGVQHSNRVSQTPSTEPAPHRQAPHGACGRDTLAHLCSAYSSGAAARMSDHDGLQQRLVA